MNDDQIRLGTLHSRRKHSRLPFLGGFFTLTAALWLAALPCGGQRPAPPASSLQTDEALAQTAEKAPAVAAVEWTRTAISEESTEIGSEAAASDSTAVDTANEPGEDDALPDAPQPQQTDAPQDSKPLVAAKPLLVPVTTARPIVSRYSKYIPAGAAAPQIHGREKLILGARDLYSPGNFLDIVFSAGWEQVTNSQPNYGTDRGAFGQRLGAAAIRETSEGILTDGVFSVMLHEDPRYFVLGPKYGLVHRTLYAITRPLITRNSSNGHSTINGAMILGFAGSAALTNAYYPKINRNFHDTAATFGGSFGGAAIGFFVDEFSGQVLKELHLKKKL